MASSSVTKSEGTGIAVRGNDIDTDRIIPARFLRMITFEGLGEYAFEDDRKSNPAHPFGDAKFAGASILVANDNFGCGSSREHAPQALQRWGIKAIVAESFAEIFQGNCTAMGVPCVTAAHADVDALQSAIEADPSMDVTVDLARQTVSYGDTTLSISIPKGNRSMLLEGAWDATGMLLEGAEATKETAASLPYVSGYAG